MTREQFVQAIGETGTLHFGGRVAVVPPPSATPAAAAAAIRLLVPLIMTSQQSPGVGAGELVLMQRLGLPVVYVRDPGAAAARLVAFVVDVITTRFVMIGRLIGLELGRITYGADSSGDSLPRASVDTVGPDFRAMFRVWAGGGEASYR